MNFSSIYSKFRLSDRLRGARCVFFPHLWMTGCLRSSETLVSRTDTSQGALSHLRLNQGARETKLTRAQILFLGQSPR